MKRYIEIMLLVAMMLPMVHDLNTIEEANIVSVGHQHYLDGAEDAAEFTAALKPLSLTILFKALTLRRFSIIRVKCLRLLRQRPIIKSESARHSEMRSGDVSSMRI